MSGITVYVKHYITKYVNRLCPDCKFGIFLRFQKQLFNHSRDIILCFIYLPPENSPFYRTTETSGIALLESQLLTSEIVNKEASLIILGDLNARVSDIDDFINDNNIVPILEDYEDFLTDIVDKRSSCDKQVNNFGRALLNFCKTYSLLICNGRTGEDKE